MMNMMASKVSRALTIELKSHLHVLLMLNVFFRSPLMEFRGVVCTEKQSFIVAVSSTDSYLDIRLQRKSASKVSRRHVFDNGFVDYFSSSRHLQIR